MILFSAAISGFGQPQETSADFPPIPALAKNDRILILAPHPDDETLGTAGVIQRALKAGAAVYAACYTNGDANEIAFIMYEKRFTFRKGEFLHMGEVRRKETVSALKFLGVAENKIFFLGYPDTGTLQIMLKFWGKVKPYHSLLTRVSNVPYEENLSFNAPYVGESILKDIKTILSRSRPTKIFVSHPLDTNGDHQSLYLFLQVALLDLEGKIKKPQIYPYLVHCPGWPKPRGFHPQVGLFPPKGFDDPLTLWQKLDLTPEEVERKDRAISLYKSQIPYNMAYLHAFARNNELFGSEAMVILKKPDVSEINWAKVDDAGFLSYAKKGGKLCIKIFLKRGITKGIRGFVNLLGYSRETDFSDMPKIRLLLTRNKLIVYNKKSRVFIDTKMRVEDDSIIIEFPLVGLNSPDFILSRVRMSTRSMPAVAGGWHVLKVK